ncbi:MAG: hypothetical protein JW806_07680 [Sedimentisphaerales bacterium]|nr:hypothetical protein [Sedimentisphaerales bacterium]
MKRTRKKRRSTSKHFPRKGMVCVWAVVFLLLLLAATGLALDVGKVTVVATQLQNAADSAALAGARLVKTSQTQAAQKAIDTAIQNFVDGQSVQLTSSDIVPGRYDSANGTFTPITTGTMGINALKIIVRRTSSSPNGPISLHFGTLFNMDTYDISRSAIALAAGGTGAGVIALAPDGIGLRMSGNAELTVNGGAVHVNSEAGNAVRMNGNTELDATELSVVGDIDLSGNVELDPDMILNLDASYAPDPLCPDPYSDCLPEPAYDDSNDLGSVHISANDNAVLNPGYYSGGIQASGNADVTLNPGIYILDGAGIDISGNADICAKGVMLYIIGDGKVDITGNGEVNITPMQEDYDDFCPDCTYPYYPPGTDITTYENIAIFQARDNDNDAKITGNGSLNLEGTLYFSGNQVDLAGNGDTFGNQLIADTIEISGNGEIVITYDGRNPTAPNRSYLVK